MVQETSGINQYPEQVRGHVDAEVSGIVETLNRIAAKTLCSNDDEGTE